MAEIAPKEPLVIPDPGFSADENQRMNILLKQGEETLASPPALKGALLALE